MLLLLEELMLIADAVMKIKIWKMRQDLIMFSDKIKDQSTRIAYMRMLSGEENE